MKKIIVVLGAKKNATEDQLVNMIDGLIKENKDHVINLKKAGDDITKLTNEKEEMAEMISKEEFDTSIEELKGEVSDLQAKVDQNDELVEGKDKEIAGLKGQIEDIKLTQANNAIDVKVLEKRVTEFFKANKEIKEIFVTDDGEIFLQESPAFNHRRTIGGRVQTFKQK